jgi:hypothetical protein
MNVSDFIGKKVIIRLPDIPVLTWYGLFDTGEREPNISPYNNCVGTATIRYTNETITEEDDVVVVQFHEAHLLPNGQRVDWIPVPIDNLEIIEGVE